MAYPVRQYFPQIMAICGHTFIADLLNPHSCVVDLGANNGSFTKTISDVFGSIVYAVEPIPQLYSQIEANERISKFDYCIVADSGPVSMQNYVEVCASLFRRDEAQDGDEVAVRGINLDQFLNEEGIKRIDLLKVDIEGAELDVFDSLEASTLEGIKQATVEFHDFIWPDMHSRVESVKRRMESNGFYCIPFSLNNGDVLFVRKDLITPTAYHYLRYFVKYRLGSMRVIRRNLHL